MEIFMHHPKMLFLLCLLLHSIYFATSQPYIGVNLGPSTRYRPDPTAQAKFLNSTYIRKLRMYTVDSHVIRPMADIDVSVVVATPNNQYLQAMAKDPVNYCGRLYIDGFRKFNLFKQIHMILVGNKVLDSGDKTAIDNLLPAMQNMQNYVDNAGLHGQIKISTVLSLHALTNSDIPSNASFNPAYYSTIKPLLAFLRENESPFMMETYPYYQYLDNPTPQMLAFCLFQPNAGRVDPVSGLKYMNMFDVKVDAFRTALNGLQYQDLEIVVAETGWPSNGDDNEIGATMENARLYNANLIHKLRSMVGTPLMPKKAVETYISSLFDEDSNEGPTSQRSFGIAHTDLTWKFNLYLDKRH